MFAFKYLAGCVRILCWRVGFHVEGTAPTLSTAYKVYGWWR